MIIPFATQSYESRIRPLSAQRCVNYYPEIAPVDAKSPVGLIGTPGLKPYTTLATNPIRGQIEMDGLHYVIAGNTAYKLDRAKTATSLGTIPGSGEVVGMATNGTEIVVLINTTSSGGYVITSSTVTQITDPDFLGATSVDFIDNYFIFTRTGTGQFFISGLVAGGDYDALDFATTEGAPDDLIGVLVDHREVWLGGKDSIEIWYNSGASPFPFERLQGVFIERGLLVAKSLLSVDNTAFWIGDDRVVYRADGYTPIRVSTHGIEKILEDNEDLSDLTAFSYTQEGHVFYVLKKPRAFTVAFDVSTGRWHERASYGRLDWQACCFLRIFDKLLVGSDTTGDLYELDLDTYSENGQPLVARAVSPALWAEGNAAEMHNLIVDFETGVGLTTGQGSNPQAMLRWSDDGGYTWSHERRSDIGKIGKRNTVARWDRLGQFKQRYLEISVSDPVKRSIMGALAETRRGKL